MLVDVNNFTMESSFSTLRQRRLVEYTQCRNSQQTWGFKFFLIRILTFIIFTSRFDLTLMHINRDISLYIDEVIDFSAKNKNPKLNFLL